jgi:hypothetical protein
MLTATMNGEPMEVRRILPADVYDTLEFSALAFGGVGGVIYFDYDALDRSARSPRCIHGHASAATNPESDYFCTDNPISSALVRVGIFSQENDAAVGLANRISFKTWCRRLGVVRGES